MDLNGGGGEWAFKGEGNANIVFEYRGNDPDLVRLRVVGQAVYVCQRRAGWVEMYV